MDKSSESEVDEAKRFLQFYETTIDNQKGLFKYHLAENAVLDWFGKTVKGLKNIKEFLNTSATSCTHHFTNVKVVDKIGFRDTHIVNLPKKNVESCTNVDGAAASAGERFIEQGQGDGLHNCSSPLKKSRIENENSPIKYLIADGHLEFTGSSTKKMQQETRWSRPCKLQIAYTQTSFDDCTIYLMIYEGNLKCRRNLLKEFEASTSHQ